MPAWSASTFLRNWRVPVEVEYASEFRYRNPPMDRNTIILTITQSGETADTLAALRESKRKGHPTLSLCNVVGSSIAREADGGVYLHAGPEVGVASTKAFTAQVAVLTLLALYLGRMRHLSSIQGAAHYRGNSAPCRTSFDRHSSAMTWSGELPKNTTRQATFSTWAASIYSRLFWRAR